MNEGEHMVVNQVVEEVNPSVEVGSDNCGTSQEPDFTTRNPSFYDKTPHDED